MSKISIAFLNFVMNSFSWNFVLNGMSWLAHCNKSVNILWTREYMRTVNRLMTIYTFFSNLWKKLNEKKENNVLGVIFWATAIFFLQQYIWKPAYYLCCIYISECTNSSCLKWKWGSFFGVCVLIKRGKDLTREVLSSQIFGRPDRSKIINLHRVFVKKYHLLIL